MFPEEFAERVRSATLLWGLESLTFCPEISTSLIGYGVANGRPVVLKLSRYPQELAREVRALQTAPGAGFPDLIHYDAERAAALMERLDVDGDLSTIFPDAAAEARIWRAVADQIAIHPPTGDGWARLDDQRRAFDLAATTGQLPEAIRRGREALEALLDQPERVWTHGDLHHFNVLRTPTGWRPIDPHGMLAPRDYELAAFLRNPYPPLLTQCDTGRKLAARYEAIANELARETRDIIRLAYVGCSISIAWSIEDGEPVSPEIARLSELLRQL